MEIKQFIYKILIAYSLCALQSQTYASDIGDIISSIKIPSYKVLGQLDDKVASFLTVEAPDLEKEEFFPLILAKASMEEFRLPEQEYIKKAYDKHHIITLPYPNEQSYKLLFQFLDIVSPSTPLNIEEVMFYSIKKRQGSFNESFMMALKSCDHTIVENAEENSEDEGEISSDNPTLNERFQQEELKVNSIEQQQRNVEQYLDWLKSEYKGELTRYMTSLMASSSENFFFATSSSENTLNLYELATTFTNDISYTKELSTKFAGKSKITQRQAKDFYQLSVSSLGCYSENKDKGIKNNYYYLALSCIFTPDDFTPFSKPRITYTIGAVPVDYAGEVGLASLIESSPSTSEGGTSTTSSISYTIGGGLGFFGKDTATGNVDGSVTFGKSKSFYCPEVRIANRSRDNTAMWQFSITPTKNGLLTRSAFEPYLQALWRVKNVPKEISNLKFALFFEAHYNYTGMKGLTFREFSNAPLLKREHWLDVSDIEKLIDKICKNPRANTMEADLKLLLSYSKIPEHFKKNKIGYYINNGKTIKYRTHDALIQQLIQVEAEGNPVIKSYIEEIIKPNILPFIFTAEYSEE